MYGSLQESPSLLSGWRWTVFAWSSRVVSVREGFPFVSIGESGWFARPPSAVTANDTITGCGL